MAGWDIFDGLTEKLTYTKVSPEYAEWSENYNNYNIDNATYTTYQDAIDVLETFIFIEDEEKKLSQPQP